MGRPKLARRLGFPCCCPWDWSEQDSETGRRIRYFSDNRFHLDNCPARLANDIMDEYDDKFPEAKRLLKLASKIAKDRLYVMTLLNRRRRYPDGWALHSALNAVIQGSAADIFKLKLLELYRERKRLGILLRMPVHDEFVYDVEDEHHARQVHKFLNRQSIQLSVPILWETGLGFNWQEANTNVLKEAA
jgi:DNA polymerase I